MQGDRQGQIEGRWGTEEKVKWSHVHPSFPWLRDGETRPSWGVGEESARGPCASVARGARSVLGLLFDMRWLKLSVLS